MSEISVVIITYNEQDFIGKCIESLKGLADEVIVVDSFSTDRTAEICRSLGVRFIQHEFEGYIKQKNWAINQSTNDLILSLDADEILSDELKKSISEVKDNPVFDGYIFNRRNNYCGKWLNHSEWYPDKQLRLFKKSKGRWVGLEPHDKFKLFAGCKTSWLKGDLLHWNFETFSEHTEKIKKLSTLGAAAYLKAGKKSGFFTAWFHTSWCFIRSYILTGGFLDGYHGYKISAINSYGCFLKYSKLRNLIREQNNSKNM